MRALKYFLWAATLVIFAWAITLISAVVANKGIDKISIVVDSEAGEV